MNGENLPYQALDVVPFTPITSEWGDGVGDDILALAAGTGLDDGAIDTPKIGNGAVTSPKLAEAFVRGRQRVGTTNTSELGYLLQWGRANTPNFTSANAQNLSVSFPTAFSSTPFIALSASHNTGAIDDVRASIGSLSASAVTFRVRVGIHGTNAPVTISWIALGPAG